MYGGGTVLHIHHGHVGVGALTEKDADGGGAVVGGRRGHVHHALYAVDGLLEWYDDALLYGLGIGTGVGCHDADGGRCYLWELLECELAQTDDAHEHHQYRYHSGEYRTVDECPYVHISFLIPLSSFLFPLSSLQFRPSGGRLPRQ